MRHQREDLEYGHTSEANVHPQLEALVSRPLQRTSHFHIFDYTDDGNTVYLELKSRRVPHNRYPTALVGKNKVDGCKDTTKDYYFCFQYEDGLYFIKYEPSLFDTFRVENDYYRSPRYGTVNRPQTLVHIPVERLTLFCKVSSERGASQSDHSAPSLPTHH